MLFCHETRKLQDSRREQHCAWRRTVHNLPTSGTDRGVLCKCSILTNVLVSAA